MLGGWRTDAYNGRILQPKEQARIYVRIVESVL